jgi:succinate dehydrogenase / fumarate reductase cytochrome b subunit
MPERPSFREELRYRGGMGMWAWALHRITGLAVLLFLSIHIVETFMLTLGPDLYNQTLALYRTAFFRVAEIALMFAVLYHAINGIRITIQDFFPSLWRYERAFIWAGAIILALVFIPLAIWGMLPVLRGEL